MKEKYEFKWINIVLGSIFMVQFSGNLLKIICEIFPNLFLMSLAIQIFLIVYVIMIMYKEIEKCYLYLEY